MSGQRGDKQRRQLKQLRTLALISHLNRRELSLVAETCGVEVRDRRLVASLISALRQVDERRLRNALLTLPAQTLRNLALRRGVVHSGRKSRKQLLKEVLEVDGETLEDRTSSLRFHGYQTSLGEARLGDSRRLMSELPGGSVGLILTSPPYALVHKKAYGNEGADDYLDWFRPFAHEFSRLLSPKGSLVVEIGGSWKKGEPQRSLYHFELLIMLAKEFGFHLAQEFYWYNTAKLPAPAEWVNVRRVRVKDAVNPIWWLSKSSWPTASNRRVLKEYTDSMHSLFRRGYNSGMRPSGHNISSKWGNNNGGAIPSNLIQCANTRAKDEYLEFCRNEHLKLHPARFPREIPDFFIKFLTTKRSLVLDPFCGSNMTGYVAEGLGRRWVSFDSDEDYLYGSLGRFLPTGARCS